MREAGGDLFALAERDEAWVVVTTYGCVSRGTTPRLVMGAGVGGLSS